MDTDKPVLSPTTEAPKRPYAAPTLVVHGDARMLTQTIKIGTDPDQDNGGSFIPDGEG